MSKKNNQSDQIYSFATLLVFCYLLNSSNSAVYKYNTCNSTSILNPNNLACTSCPNPTTQIPNPYQAFPISCICKNGYGTSTNNVCYAYSSCNDSQIYQVINLDGSTNTNPTCLSCANNAYPNTNRTRCIPCATGMLYNASQGGCYCAANGDIKTDLGCFGSTLSPPSTSSIYYNQLKYLIPGCSTFQDFLSCSQIVNLCTYSQANGNAPECQFFANNSYSSYMFASSSNFSLTASKTGSMNLKLIKFLATGNYVGEKSLELEDIFRCGTPSNPLDITIGSNIQSTCSFNFNNLAGWISAQTYKNYLYQILIKADDGSYYEVGVSMPSSTQPIRRFFLEDAYSITGKANVLTSMTLSFSLNSNGFLTNPSLSVGYTLLSMQNGVGIVPVSSITQTITHSILFTSSLSTFWTGAIISFIVISVAALVHAIIKTYIGYLNRKSALLFFLNFMSMWSLWMFYYLLFMTGYWFVFTKTTSNIYLLVPQDTQFYIAFYVVAGTMGLFRIITVLIDKNDKLNTEVFMINWEKDSFKNSWREIFIVNSLAEFYTHRTISNFWIMTILLFFMTGLHWQKHAAETITTTLSSISYINPQNRMLLYFLSCSIMLVIGVIFKILRRLSVVIWPYPFEDFVDYCNVTNISFFFIKKRSPEAFYIHASMPDRTEVSYKEINEAIRRGISKTRSITQEMPASDNLKMYVIYMCKELEGKFNQMIKQIEDQEHNVRIKYGGKENKKTVNYREQFIESKLKPYLETISNKENNQIRKTLLQSLCGIPIVDLRDENALKGRNHIIFDDKMDLVNEVFPNGNEFQEIHTLIIIYLMWILITNSSPISAFLTYLIDEYIFNGWITYRCKKSLEKMTRVKEGFML